MKPDSLQLINSTLVPAMMIVASAILLFSMNGKYSTIVNRIRDLKEEKIKLQKESDSGKERDKRYNNIELQISHLIHRIAMVRFSIVSYSAAVLFFAVSAILLAIRASFDVNGYYWVILGFFFAGLLAITNGVVFAVIEMFKGYRIVHIEISEISHGNK